MLAGRLDLITEEFRTWLIIEINNSINCVYYISYIRLIFTC